MANDIYQPSDAELEILQVIWERQPVSVREIFERIGTTKGVGYTTILKQVQRLTEKGALTKEDAPGGAHLYRAVFNETEVKKGLVNKLLDTAFGGSALQLMQHALGQGERVSAEELAALKQWLDQQKPE
jgi:predicted transcriptional regulator